MKKTLLLIFLISFSGVSQTQIGDIIKGQTANDRSGQSISLSSNGSIVAVGAPDNDNSNGGNSGHVRIYKYDTSSTDWVQIGSNINGEAANDKSGQSISLSSDGSIVAIGATNNDDNNNNININRIGHVRVYQYDTTSKDWRQIGTDIDGEKAGDDSGWSVSLSADGTILAIGTIHGNIDDSGYVKVYKYDTSLKDWRRMGGKINGEVDDRLGWSISISSDGSIIAIGSPFHNANGENSGLVKVYKYNSALVDWVQIGNDIYGETTNNASGSTVSISSNGSILAIGSSNYTDKTGDPGYVKFYKYNAALKDWVQIGNTIKGETANKALGTKVSLSSNGSLVAITSINKTGDDEGDVRVYDLNAVLSSNPFVLSQFSMSPNPSRKQTTIKLNTGLTLKKTTIYNNLGQFIQSTNKEVIDTSGLSSGMYFVQIVTDKGNATKKLVIE